MFSEKGKARVSLLVLLVVLAASVSAFGGSAVVGSVAGSMNATMGGQALLPNTTVFSGDSLAVKDGAAVVAVEPGSRLVFGRETVASFLRETGEVTVLLGQGNVSLYRAAEGVSLRVKVGEVSILPVAGFKTLGEVALLNGVVVVTAKEGKLRVEGSGPAVEVVKGKTITLSAREARSPQGGAAGSGGSAGISSSTGLQLATVGAAGVSAVFSGVAISRAGDARDAAAAANGTAAAAVAAAQAAEAAAQAAADAANAAGCALNNYTQTSVYTPPEGMSCPSAD
ncbi:MAG: hypothetical protein ABSA70_07365 [Terriglobia bacterium]